MWKISLFLLEGLGTTVGIVLVSSIIALIISFAVGLIRQSSYKTIKIIAVIYVEIFRGTSLLVQLFWLYFVLPLFGIKLPSFLTAVLAIGLNYGAYGSEIVRSAIMAVPKEQYEASIALSFTPYQRMRKIILPQALVMMMPSFGNLQIELLKATSLVSLITLKDLTYYSTILNTATMKTTEIYIILLILYFLISRPLIAGIRYIEKKISIWRE
jgi:polar amino acid transport system permease protein